MQPFYWGMRPIVQNGIKAKHFPLSPQQEDLLTHNDGQRQDSVFARNEFWCFAAYLVFWLVIRLSVALGSIVPAHPLMTPPLSGREISSRSAPSPDCPWIWGQNMSIATSTKNQSIQAGGMCRHLYSSIRATMRGDDRKISRQTHKDSETVGKEQEPC